MHKLRNTLFLLSTLLTPLAGGCAPAYHNYAGCYVDCRYCPPPPLPYTCYDECVCHACVVQPYLTETPATEQ